MGEEGVSEGSKGRPGGTRVGEDESSAWTHQV